MSQNDKCREEFEKGFSLPDKYVYDEEDDLYTTIHDDGKIGLAANLNYIYNAFKRGLETGKSQAYKEIKAFIEQAGKPLKAPSNDQKGTSKLRVDSKGYQDVVEKVGNAIRDEICFRSYVGDTKLPPQDLDKITKAAIQAYEQATLPKQQGEL